MKQFSVSDFVWAVWEKLHIVSFLLLLVIFMGLYISDEINSFILIIILFVIANLIHLVISAPIYIMYRLLLYIGIKYINIRSLQQLKLVLYVTLMIDILILSLFFCWYETLSSRVLMTKIVLSGCAFLGFAISGQIAIYWVIKRGNPFEKVAFHPEKIDGLINEIGTEIEG